MELDLDGKEYDIIRSMQYLRNFFKHNWSVILVLIIGILASRTLLFQKGYFNMHDDLQMMRQLEMEKCFSDFQIPCRWVPDMGYEYGFPLFNFYPPLPYLVGQIFRLLGFSFINTAKLLFATSLIASGFSMYYLVYAVSKNKLSALVSSTFYIWAPYHAVDVYVRGAMNESWALIFFPLVFLFSYKLINLDTNKNNKTIINNSVILLALSWAGLLMSHNLMVMIFGPVFAVWCLILFWYKGFNNFWLNVKQLIFSGLLSLGLSSYFTFPAIFENNLTWLKSQLVGYYDYTAHFVTLYQLLISRFWGYGPSTWLEEDGMAFPAGQIHWVLSIVVIILWFFNNYLKKNKKKQQKDISVINYLIPFLFIVGWFSAFMTHVRSTFVYQMFDFIALVQFPWRFLTIVIFSFSFLSGLILIFIPQKISKITTPLLIVLCLYSSWNFFLPEHGKMGKLTDQEKLSGEAWRLQTTAGIMDYLPLTAKENPRDGKKVLAEILDKKGDLEKDQTSIGNFTQGTDWAYFDVDTTKELTVRINIFMFPNWRIYKDNIELKTYIPEGERWGRIWVSLPEGKYRVYAKFENTLVRSISNYISIFSWLGLIGLWVVQFRSENNRFRNTNNKKQNS